jgi:hypothetical protein
MVALSADSAVPLQNLPSDTRNRRPTPLMAYHFKSDLSEALDHQINKSQNDKYYSCGALFAKRSSHDCPASPALYRWMQSAAYFRLY